MKGEHLLDLSKAHTSIHIGPVTVVVADVSDSARIQALRDASELLHALLMAEEGELYERAADLGLPTINWPDGVELPGGGDAGGAR